MAVPEDRRCHTLRPRANPADRRRAWFGPRGASVEPDRTSQRTARPACSAAAARRARQSRSRCRRDGRHGRRPRGGPGVAPQSVVQHIARRKLCRPQAPATEPTGTPFSVQRLQMLDVLERVHRRPEPVVADSRAARPAAISRGRHIRDEVLARADLIEDFAPEHEVAAVDPQAEPCRRPSRRDHPIAPASNRTRWNVYAHGRTATNAAIFPALELADEVRQRRVRQASP